MANRTLRDLAILIVFASNGLWGCGSDDGAERGGSSGYGAPELLAQDQQKLSYVAVDGERVYFAGFDAVPTLRACPKAGGPVEVLWEGAEVATFDLAVDSSGIYGGMTSLWRADLAGGKPLELAASIEVDELAVDDTHVYATTDASVVRVPKSGGAPEVLAQVAGPSSIAVDETHAYYGAGAAVMRVPKAGGAVETVGSANFTVMHLALGSSHVYVLPMGQAPVVRLPKAGGTAETVFEVPASDVAEDVFVFDDDVYYHSVGGIDLIPGGSGSSTTLLADEDYVYDVAADASGVYFTVRNDDHVMRLPKR